MNHRVFVESREFEQHLERHEVYTVRSDISKACLWTVGHSNTKKRRNL